MPINDESDLIFLRAELTKVKISLEGIGGDTMSNHEQNLLKTWKIANVSLDKL